MFVGGLVNVKNITQRQTHRQTAPQTVHVCGRMAGRVEIKTDRQTNRLGIDGWMNGWMQGQVKTDRQTVLTDRDQRGRIHIEISAGLSELGIRGSQVITADWGDHRAC